MLFGLVAIACLAGCATVPDRCYIVLSKDGVKAEICEKKNLVRLLGTPQFTEAEIPPYIKGILAYEGIAYQ